jgi:hypothetical protein
MMRKKFKGQILQICSSCNVEREKIASRNNGIWKLDSWIYLFFAVIFSL